MHCYSEFHEQRSRELFYSAQGDVKMTQVIIVNSLEDVPPEVREILQIQRDRQKLINEIDDMLCRYHPRGLHYSIVWSRERAVRESVKEFLGWK